jgi:membrane protein DedA with SNARE-associated domain
VLMTAAALGSSSPPLPGFLNALASPLQNYGYWAIGLLVLVEDFGIPVPGETILIAGAIYAGADRLNIVAVGVVAFITAILGDNIGFAIGHFGGRALVLRWGKYVFLTEERLNRAEHFFERHGGKIITVARFIEGLRQANGIIAGISGMHWRRFLAFNALGAALWVGTWASLGYLAGNHITTIYHYITQYSYYVLIAVVVLLVAYIIWRLRGRSRHHMPAVTSAADEEHETGSTTEAAELTPSDAELTSSEPTGHVNGALEASDRSQPSEPTGA